jgi:uncharacterized membrane protein YqaE (UPF0057 family)
MKKFTFLFALLVAFALGSCGSFKEVSIEKRHYRKGYYVHVRDDRSSEKTVLAGNAPVAENTWTEKNSTVENTGTVVENNAQPVTEQTEKNPGLKKFFGNFSKPFKRGSAVFREKTNSIVSSHHTATKTDDDDRAVALVLLVILAIILPPLAVLLADGVGVKFLIDLIFWLLGFGFVIFISGIGFVFLGIFGLLAIIYALLVVFDAI